MHDTRRRISPRGARSSGVHLRPDSAASGGLPGLEAAHEGSLVNCHRCGGARGRQRLGDHEQCLQEQPSWMVRSNLRRPAPHEDETQLTRVGEDRGADRASNDADVSTIPPNIP
jgi:hypothetical protein